MSDRSSRGRRAFLRAIGGGVGVGFAVGAAGGAAAIGAVTAGAPTVEWAREFEGAGSETLYLRSVVQAADGGFALGGDGIPGDAPSERQFSAVGVSGEGERRWGAFAPDDDATTTQQLLGFTRTTDGGYVVAGYAGYPDEPVSYYAGTKLGQAAKVGPDGTVQWLRSFDALEDDDRDDPTPELGKADSAVFYDVAPTPDGGAVGCGYRNDPCWATMLAADGSVEWEVSYPQRHVFTQVFRRGDGYDLIASPDQDDPFHAVRVDATGKIQRTTTLDVAYDLTTLGVTFVPTPDGGFAYTGRDPFGRGMVLVKLDAAGRTEWEQQYPGPGDEQTVGDRARDLIRTRDGGFLLAGYMSEAETGEPRPAILKTDADGSEVWRRILTDRRDIVGDTGFSDVIQTSNGGFAAVAMPWLVKFGPGDEGLGTTTSTRTQTRTTTSTTDGETETPTQTRGPTKTTTTGVPGFGVLGAVGGLVGAGYRLVRRAEDGDPGSDE